MAKAFNSGFVHVFSASIVSQLVAFCGSIIYVHLMGQQQFGVYTFAYTIISFFLLVNGFGAASGILQFVSRAPDEATRLAYLKHSMKWGILFNCGLSLGIFCYALFMPLPIAGSKKILCAMAFFPIGRLYIDVFQAYLRATLQNQLLAKFAISSNVLLLLSNVAGLYYAGLMGFVVATYISYLIVILLATFVYKLPNIFTLKSQLINVREFISYSMYITVGNAFAQLLFILDILILGYIIKNAVVLGVYKVATVIPFAINFIPGVVSTFFYPYFAKNADNLDYVRQLKNKLQKGMFVFSGLTSFGLIILAKPIISLIFGQAYIDSVVPFQILSFGFWILATFRNINGNVLAALGKAKFAMWLNVGIVSVNMLLTYFLVIHWGIIGAAVGVVIIYTISGVIAGSVLRQLLSKN
jgi:O-antigen/teichoic acid export membrane protein